MRTNPNCIFSFHKVIEPIACIAWQWLQAPHTSSFFCSCNRVFCKLQLGPCSSVWLTDFCVIVWPCRFGGKFLMMRRTHLLLFLLDAAPTFSGLSLHPAGRSFGEPLQGAESVYPLPFQCGWCFWILVLVGFMYLHLIDIDLKYLTSSLHKFGFLTKDWVVARYLEWWFWIHEWLHLSCKYPLLTSFWHYPFSIFFQPRQRYGHATDSFEESLQLPWSWQLCEVLAPWIQLLWGIKHLDKVFHFLHLRSNSERDPVARRFFEKNFPKPLQLLFCNCISIISYIVLAKYSHLIGKHALLT